MYKIVFVLLAVFVAITVYTAKTTINQNKIIRGQNLNELQTNLYSDLRLIKSQILGCVISFPNGDNGTTFHIQYPGAISEISVSDLICPGETSTNKSLWNGHYGVFFPKIPSGFTEPVYKNSQTEIYFSISSDGNIENNQLLARIANKFDSSEADITGNTLKIWIIK